jgi:hypothetical protein
MSMTGRSAGIRLAAGTLLLAAGIAHAELGGDLESVRADVQRMHGTLRITALQDYDLHEITASNGAAVRQYMNRAGQVFAISWRAPGPVDLHALLGSWYARYAAHGAARIDLHHAALASPELVVEVAGALNSFSGRAYLPDQLPAGVPSREIR